MQVAGKLGAERDAVHELSVIVGARDQERESHGGGESIYGTAKTVH